MPTASAISRRRTGSSYRSAITRPARSTASSISVISLTGSPVRVRSRPPLGSLTRPMTACSALISSVSQPAVAHHRDAVALELVADAGEHRVVEALRGQVVVGEGDPEPPVDGVVVILGIVDELLPQADGLRVAALQQDHPVPRPLGEGRVGVELD